jgi:hypothetical protein
MVLRDDKLFFVGGLLERKQGKRVYFQIKKIQERCPNSVLMAAAAGRRR